MDKLLTRMAGTAAVLLVTAGPAYAAKAFAAELDCGGVFEVGDDVPFDVTFADLDGKRDKIFVTVTLEVPGGYNNELVGSGVVRLVAGEERTFFRIASLPPDGPTGSYSLFMNASSDDHTEIVICDFVVE